MKNPVIEPFLKLPARSKIFGSRLKTDGRIAFLTGRFAGGEADLALRHRQAGDGIHHQQHALALIAEIFGHGQRDEGGADAQRRGQVGRRDHHHAALQAFGAQFVFDEIADLAVALADQRDHADVGGIVARHRAEQSALADAAAAEDSDALPFAAGQQAVDRADAGDQRLRDVLPLERAGGARVQIVRGSRRRSAAQPSIGLPKPSSTRPSNCGPTSMRAVFAAARSRDRPVAGRPVSSSGIEQHAPVAEPDHLGADRSGRSAGMNLAEIAHRRRRPFDSTSKPTSSVTRPVQLAASRCAGKRVDVIGQASVSHSSPQQVGESAFDFRNCVSTEASSCRARFQTARSAT